MERIYAKLYQLQVSHLFYADKKSTDFSFYPIGNATKNMRNSGLMYRAYKDGFELVYRTLSGSNNPFIPNDSVQILTFGVAVENVNALSFTAFPDKSNNSDIYYANGTYSDGTINFSALASRQTGFTENFTYDFEKITFRIIDKDSNKIYEEIQTGLPNTADETLFDFSFSVNFGDAIKMGVYKIQTFKNGILQDENEVYIFNRFKSPNLIGIFELELNNLINYETLPYSSKFEFEPVSSLWKYQIELTRDFKSGDFSIANADEDSTITFSETTSLDDYLKGEVVIFEASDVMTKSDIPNSNFSLVVTSDDDDITLNGLPNPSNHNSNSIVYLKI